MRVQSLRGFNDVLPEQAPYWRLLLDAVQRVMDRYGYTQIHLPVVEATELFRRSVGEATDIVEKEMFSFSDRDRVDMSLRPEGTAGCVRAGIEHGLLHNQQQRLWYQGPMFRHERPQAGRYRQFHQVGVEAFGMTGPAADIEVIALSARLWREIGLDGLTLEINTLGSPACRQAYREALQGFLRSRRDALDADARSRVESNPLRVLDTKHPQTREAIADAPAMADYLSDAAQAHFDTLRRGLDALGIDWLHNPRLVRGLDYYTHSVFEWTTDALGAQGTVCAGGRYDGLVAQLGGGDVPAVGFALGIERLVLLLQQQAALPAAGAVQVYLCWMDEAGLCAALTTAEALRDRGIAARVDATGGGFKGQFRRADRSGAAWAVIAGAEEIAAGQLQIKSLRQRAEPEFPAIDRAVDVLCQRLDAGTSSASP